jgi:hypothetical protein
LAVFLVVVPTIIALVEFGNGTRSNAVDAEESLTVTDVSHFVSEALHFTQYPSSVKVDA